MARNKNNTVLQITLSNDEVAYLESIAPADLKIGKATRVAREVLSNYIKQQKTNNGQQAASKNSLNLSTSQRDNNVQSV